MRECVTELSDDFAVLAEFPLVGSVGGKDAVLAVEKNLGVGEAVEQIEQIGRNLGLDEFLGGGGSLGGHGSYVMSWVADKSTCLQCLRIFMVSISMIENIFGVAHGVGTVIAM
jgi:hypothetical protein